MVLRPTWSLVALFVVGFSVIFAYAYVTRNAVTPGASVGSVRVAPPAQAASVAAPASPPPEASVESQPVVETQNASESPRAVLESRVAQLSADVVSDDPKKRSTAIAALADVPKAQALPVLQNVLMSGDRETERPLALRTLRTIAERQGDADSTVRETLRHVIYHGDDDATTQGAQAALGDIENGLATPAPSRTK